jgi:hypothetical protein
MTIKFVPLPTDKVRALRAGGLDVYGNAAEIAVSDGDGIPCRHCLKMVAKGDRYLIASWRPFSTLQPYAETGPVFLHADECQPDSDASQLPEFLDSPDYIVRGYGANERIVYGSGAVTPRGEITKRAESLLARDDIAFVDIRSARNNCYHCRVVVAD